MYKTFILIPGAVSAGTDITVPEIYLDGGKLIKLEKIIKVTVDFTGTTLTTADVTSDAVITGDNTFKFNTTNVGANEFLVITAVVRYEPGVTQ